MPLPTEITPSQLSRLIGTPNAPDVVDVRTDEDFNDDPRLLPGAWRHPWTEHDTLADRIPNRRAVIVCHKGLKVSQGVAAHLRISGIQAETLVGGFCAWRETGEPLVPADRIPALDGAEGTLWVTRHRPKIDRIACPWLIRRFVDRRARFLFVAPSEVRAVAERFSATPFDVEDIFWSHRGNRCTFDTMIEEFCLGTEPLSHLAAIVRGADTDRWELAPQAPGLLALSLGLSRLYKDDLAQLDAGLTMYDALYRWARDAREESHDWPAS
ncbi:MAG: chromate resistance protein ChrB domain-containing protein [Pseudomonadota bacterium]